MCIYAYVYGYVYGCMCLRLTFRTVAVDDAKPRTIIDTLNLS